MDYIYGSSPEDYKSYSTEELRKQFLIENLFSRDEVCWTYTYVDRLLLGGACPVNKSLSIGDGKIVGAPTLCSARELGIVNLGGTGSIKVDGVSFDLAKKDVLYVGRGSKAITFSSGAPAAPARFLIASSPAGADYPTRLITAKDSKPLLLGENKRANVRQLNMYIHPEVMKSALLMMGVTDLADGSIWNTMPPHTHVRRMEAYCYFDLEPGDRVLHLMGEAKDTRHLWVGDGQVVVSPAWSIHMGAGTGPYSFVWIMTGENQEYTDMQPVAITDLR